MSDAVHVVRTAPLGQSILWRPTEREAPSEIAHAVPIYIRQRALAALHDHLRGAGSQGILGFLVGDLCEDPGTQERWVEIQLVVRLTQAIYGDKTTIVIARVWERLQQEVERTGGHMLGWYHSHPPGGVELGANDLEAHEQYFPKAWQVSLVVAGGERGFQGAFYRPAGLPVEANGVLPFLEVVDPESITPEGKKRTRVTWKNYKPDARRLPAGVMGMKDVMKVVTAQPALPPPLTASGKQPAISADASRVRLGGAAQAPPSPPAPPSAPPPPAATAPPAGPVSGKQQALEAPAPPPPPPPRAVPSSGKQPAIRSPAPPLEATAATGAAARPPHAVGRRSFTGGLPGEEKRSRLPLVLLLALVLAGGGGAAWWFVLRPRTGSPVPGGGGADSTTATVVPRDTGSVSADTSTQDTLPVRDTTQAAAPAEPPPAAAQPVAPRRDTAPARRPTAAPNPAVVGPLVQFDRVTDSLAAALRRYQDRARRFDTGTRQCDLLGRALVAVDEQWLVYSSEKRGLDAPLDPPRMGRDAELYATVDSVQAHFDRSGCARP